LPHISPRLEGAGLYVAQRGNESPAPGI